LTERKPYQVLAWFGTAMILASAVAAAFNIYPLYLWMFLVSNGIWAAVGYLWRENSLIILNTGLTIVYIVGLVFE
tara:strand:- start:8777 stop:9001 length:225 start_codon:yes stop_codon:yes gene_type:complete